tara:strand:- start:823 stop:1200 length:378 start_codon:yes stop_codon:yes gene_type:complete
MDKSEIQHIKSEENIAKICKSPHLPDSNICDYRKTIFLDAFAAIEIWYENLNPQVCNHFTKSQLSKDAKRFVKDNAKFSNKPSGFIAGTIWIIIAHAIIAWMIQKIMDWIWNNYRTGKRNDSRIE